MTKFSRELYFYPIPSIRQAYIFHPSLYISSDIVIHMEGEFKISIRIPEGMYLRMQKLIKAGFYGSDSELIRDAVRLLLEKYGLLEVE